MDSQAVIKEIMQACCSDVENIRRVFGYAMQQCQEKYQKQLTEAFKSFEKEDGNLLETLKERVETITTFPPMTPPNPYDHSDDSSEHSSVLTSISAPAFTLTSEEALTLASTSIPAIASATSQQIQSATTKAKHSE